MCTNLKIDHPNFRIKFEEQQKHCIASWMWMGDRTTKLQNHVTEYRVPENIRHAYKQELKAWIQKRWLVLYSEEKLGPSKGTNPSDGSCSAVQG